MSGRAVRGQDAPFVRNEASDARDQREDGITFSFDIYFLSPKSGEIHGCSQSDLDGVRSSWRLKVA